ncbi:Uncharacterised protein [Actinobacillus pleuropneumoniae]|nr:Uncharacterised protein [Actinobacillus pleuropneumoniae]
MRIQPVTHIKQNTARNKLRKILPQVFHRTANDDKQHQRPSENPHQILDFLLDAHLLIDQQIIHDIFHDHGQQ